MAGFRSLRERLGGPPDPDEILPLTVLPYMRQPLFQWLQKTSDRDVDQADRWTLLCQMLKIDYTGTYPSDAIVSACNEDNDVLLDLIDARLLLGVRHDNVKELK